MSHRYWRTLPVLLRSWLVLATICASVIAVSARAWGQQIAYSTADRATVRVIAVKGLDMVKDRANGEDVWLAVVNAGHGTGVVVSTDGLVVTAHHVIAGASHVVVSKLNDPSPYLARVVATDAKHDVAVLSIAGTHRDFLPIPERTVTLNARQTVFAIGYPLDVRRSDPQSSRGIVSGVDPSGLLQLNMSINPGNSGGPVLDERDHLLGIAVATRKHAEGIAFVVPASLLGDLVVSLSPKARTASHKAADDKAQSDQLLAHLVVSFAQQVHLLGGIWEAMDRDHLASMRGLIERILGEHREMPDVLALVAGYFWNEALVLRTRGEDEWQAQQLRSVTMCKRAHRIDVGIDRRSPFVAEVLALQSPDPAAPVASRHQPPSAASEVDQFGGVRVATRRKPAASTQTGQPERQSGSGLVDHLAGFRLGWSRTDLESACRQAGHQLDRSADGGYRCSGSAESGSHTAVVDFRMCPQKVCQISVRSPLTEAQGSEWLGRLGALKNQYEGLYGRAQRNVDLPSRCRDDILPCLRDGSAKLEYRWQGRSKSLSVLIGRRAGGPEMTVSLSKLR